MPISKASKAIMELLAVQMQSKSKTWSKKKQVKMKKRVVRQQSQVKRPIMRNLNRLRMSKRKKWPKMLSSKNSRELDLRIHGL